MNEPEIKEPLKVYRLSFFYKDDLVMVDKVFKTLKDVRDFEQQFKTLFAQPVHFNVGVQYLRRPDEKTA